MSDEKPVDPTPPIGDASHLCDDLPPARLDEQPIPVPIRLEDDAKGAAPRAVMPGVVEHVVSGQEQVDGLKLLKEPCTACDNFFFPIPESQEYRWIVGMIKTKLSTLPAWQRDTLRGRDPDEWGVCRKLNAAVHMTNTFECWTPRTGRIGPHLAKDRRDG